MKLFFFILVSFNVFANENCNPPLTLGGGQDYNRAIEIVVSELCKKERLGVFERNILGRLQRSLSNCLETFKCKRAKEEFLNNVLTNSSRKSLRSAIELMKSDPDAKRFLDDSSENLQFTIKQYKRSIEDTLENNKRELKFQLEQYRKESAELKELKNEIDDQENKCRKQRCYQYDLKRIADLKKDYGLRLSSLSDSERKLKQTLDSFDYYGKAKEITEKIKDYHKETKKVLLQKVKDDPLCRGVKALTIDECAKVSGDFRTLVQRQNEEYEKVSDIYKDFDKELKEAVDDNELMNLITMSTISQVREELGVDQGDDSYMLNQLYEKMDSSLLGKYINEKAAAAVCAAKNKDLTCNLSDPESKAISNIESLTKEIESNTMQLRKKKSGKALDR